MSLINLLTHKSLSGIDGMSGGLEVVEQLVLRFKRGGADGALVAVPIGLVA